MVGSTFRRGTLHGSMRLWRRPRGQSARRCRRLLCFAVIVPTPTALPVVYRRTGMLLPTVGTLAVWPGTACEHRRGNR